MKKIIILFVAVAAVVASLVSCNKTDSSKSLSGTSWVANFGGEDTVTITFTGKTTCKLTTSVVPDVINGTYVYNAPEISITAKDMESGQSKTISGTVAGNKMSLTDPEVPSEVIVFTKQ